MRIYALYIVVFILAVYAWRDWYISLCGLIVMTAFMGHPDMPRSIMGIQGLNTWNVLLVAVAVPWAVKRRQEGRRWDLPPWGTGLLVCYVVVVVLACFRAAMDVDSFPKAGTEGSSPIGITKLISDHLINSLKYLVPGIMLYDGCRTRSRLTIGLVSTLMMALVFSTVVVRAVPVSGLKATGKAEMKQRRQIGKRVGFHANSVAMISTAGFWGVMAASALRKRRWHLIVAVGAALITGLAVAMCRSRAGYLSFVVLGLLYAAFMWRSLLVMMPLGIAILCVAFPGLPQRALQGIGEVGVAGGVEHNLHEVTASRWTVIWPPAIEQVSEAPLFGHGRLSLLRRPSFDAVTSEMGHCPMHPHNAYLEMLMDSGLVGLSIVLAMYGSIAVASVSLLRDRRDSVSRAAGGAALAAVVALLTMSVTGQSLFPKENSQMAWCLYAVAMRVWVEKRRITGAGAAWRPVVGRRR